MTKTTSFVAALGAFGALAYLLNPLPPEMPSAKKAAVASQAGDLNTPVTAQPSALGGSAAAPARAPVQNATVRLVQQIQTELLRLGCYAGAADGRWTPETQQAMHVLGERVRVLRPVETPDYIMLALARSQASHVCTAQDRATAAARVPARVVPSAAALEKAERLGTTRSARAQRAADRGHTASDTSHVPAIPHDERADNDRVLLPLDQDDLAENRMGLGAPPVDPPLVAASVAELAPRPAARHIEHEARPFIAPSRPRRDWKRKVFMDMRENGP
jgi:hypothetical protein